MDGLAIRVYHRRRFAIAATQQVNTQAGTGARVDDYGEEYEKKFDPPPDDVAGCREDGNGPVDKSNFADAGVANVAAGPIEGPVPLQEWKEIDYREHVGVGPYPKGRQADGAGTRYRGDNSIPIETARGRALVVLNTVVPAPLRADGDVATANIVLIQVIW
ncbi:hypothetical protein NPX13_g4605 [Xylaria arbuscula]|uniref:Uncharacterized protein n=1 Tax=Xylaria arbuscula TaxID=114810 RepID=A0A9W8NG08_9PEZI|nr:hypothetical protein NPX13_g4605 [Xylaria arbuscula]